MIATAPQPIPNETHGQYVVRAHKALMAAIPDPTERNQVVWEAWSAALGGDSERERADRVFDKQKFDKRPDVCYFAEHETTSKDAAGNPIVRRFDATKLDEIIQENNFRIADVDAFPTLIDRHTAQDSAADPSLRRTYGAIGPFRMGMVGRLQPKFAIFGDEYTKKEVTNEVASRPGRSVELLTLKANGRSYINPVATLSEAPRLPLPLQFAFPTDNDGEESICERYSAVAPYSAVSPAFPGGGSTFTKKFDASSPESGETNPSDQSQESGNMLQDQDIKQLVDAIMGTEQMQWVSQQMGASGTPAGGAQPGNGQPAPAPAAPSTTPQPNEQFTAGMGNSHPAMGGMQRYSANSQEIEEHSDPMDNHELVERYQAMEASQRELINDLAETKSRLASMEVERADAVRSSRLRELAGRLPAVDLNEELDRCLYSHGASMNDDAFETHFDMVERYAAKAIESAPAIPDGEMPQHQPGERETAQYQVQESETIRNLANQYANDGVAKTYTELKAEAKQLLGG